jgi:hypothetical protein
MICLYFGVFTNNYHEMKFIYTFLIALFPYCAAAQEICGTDWVHSHSLNTNLEYRENYIRIQAGIDEVYENRLANRGGEGSEQYVIPVVVHVIHLGEPVGTGSNISDAQILGAIQGMNDRFSNAIGSGVDMQMSFCLAKRDPDGCPTNGIVRVNGVSLNNYATGGVTRGGKSECGMSASDHSVKDLSKWDTYNYYNIWVVHAICGGWAGYATYPNGNEYDGAIMLADYMIYNSTTLSHEIGHGFNLPHTFDGDNNGTNCPPNSNCSAQGDRVCDTPPHKVGDCGSVNPCSSEGIWDNSRRNYMSYCGATNRFTQGQKDRVLAALMAPPRMNLLNSNACEPSDFATEIQKQNVSCVGLCDGFIMVSPSCEGEYSFLWNNGETGNTINMLCPGNYSVVISDAVSQTSRTFEFSINDGFHVEASAMIEVDGELTFCDGDSVTLSSLVTGQYAWSNGGTQSSTVITTEGNYSLSVTTAEGCSFSSTPIGVTVHPLPNLSFELPEQVTIMTAPFVLNMATPEGGEYWGPGVADGMFYPALAGVGEHTVYYTYTDINGCVNETTAHISVEPFVGIEEFDANKFMSIYPNPSDGNFNLVVNDESPIEVTCYDAHGKLIYSKQFASSGQQNIYEISLNAQASGIYYMRVHLGDTTWIKAIAIQKN